MAGTARRDRPRRRGTVGHPYSALNLRLLLASFGLVVSGVLAVLAWRAELPALTVIMVVLAGVALVDIGVIQYRRARRRREHPGRRYSAFE
jgi:hypothetical protein